MKLNKKYLLSAATMLLLGIGLIFPSYRAHATSLIGTSSQLTDTDGSVTGVTGATYYDTNSWQDMLDTYQAAPASSTVYFNITSDVPGSSVMTKSDNVINGKSLTIIGNGYTLNVDGDTNYTTGNDLQTANGWGSDGTISSSTTLKVQNAKITNDVTGGIFQMQGANAQATCIYQDVTVTNGAPTAAAQPIRNDCGKVLLEGNNTFNILQNNSFSSAGTSGADNNGEWEQGCQYTEVVNGTTTLNQNWGNDQPFYPYNCTAGFTLNIDDNANLVFNLNSTYCMDYDDNNGGPMNWTVGNNASFVINGTANTAAGGGQWFSWGISNTAWNFTIGNDSLVNISTGGGAINLDAFNGGKVNWTVGSGSQVLLNNLKTSASLFTGAPASGSGIALNSPKVFTMNTLGGAVFASSVANFPITISGTGLRTHASNTAYSFPLIDGTQTTATAPATPDLTTPNQTVIGIDIWYRQNTGTISNIGQSSFTTSLTPNPYSTSDETAISADKYLSWYQPIGFWYNASLSAMTKTFNISLDPSATNGTPIDGSWSDIISGNAGQTMVVGDDRGQEPSFNVSVEMLNNNCSNGLQFYWTDPTSGDSTQFVTGTQVPIASVTSDSALPTWITMTGAGTFYTMTIPSNDGLTVKANNSLLSASNEDAGTFQYTIADGPA